VSRSSSSEVGDQVSLDRTARSLQRGGLPSVAVAQLGELDGQGIAVPGGAFLAGQQLGIVSNVSPTARSALMRRTVSMVSGPKSR